VPFAGEAGLCQFGSYTQDGVFQRTSWCITVIMRHRGSVMATIYAYVKIYEKIEHARDFMKGKLFMNTIRAFKEHRDEAGELRGDECEGIIA